MAKIFGGLAGTAEDALRRRQQEHDRKMAEALGETPTKTSYTKQPTIKAPKGGRK